MGGEVEQRRFHLTGREAGECVTFQTVDGPVSAGEGWLLITEAEYAVLARPSLDREEVARVIDPVAFAAKLPDPLAHVSQTGADYFDSRRQAALTKADTILGMGVKDV